jgi:hypothetical protein
VGWPQYLSSYQHLCRAIDANWFHPEQHLVSQIAPGAIADVHSNDVVHLRYTRNDCAQRALVGLRVYARKQPVAISRDLSYSRVTSAPMK